MRPVTIVPLAAAAVLAACATPAADVTTDRTERLAAAAEEGELYCRRYKPTGSNRPVIECVTAEEFERLRASRRTGVDRFERTVRQQTGAPTDPAN